MNLEYLSGYTNPLKSWLQSEGWRFHTRAELSTGIGSVGSGRFASSLLRTSPPEIQSREENTTSTREDADGQEVDAAEHLWHFASEKSTLHALIIRSLSEARQRNQGSNNEQQSDAELGQQVAVHTDIGRPRTL